MMSVLGGFIVQWELMNEKGFLKVDYVVIFVWESERVYLLQYCEFTEYYIFFLLLIDGTN